MKNIFYLGIFSLFSFALCAEPMELEYKRFYSHVRKLDNDDVAALQFAFGFKHIEKAGLCSVEKAYIHTDKQDIPLQVTEEQRFTVPSDRVLKLADAKVRIELTEPLNKCDLSVQLETKPEYLKAEYSHQELAFLLSQYQAFFNEMGSFLSFMMPSVKGLMLHFADHQLDLRLANGAEVNKGLMNLSSDWIEQGADLALPVVPVRITALAKS